MELILIAAVNKRGIIGSKGTIPWDLPADRRHFKEITTGHTVIMGRKTFESIGAPLPGRRTIVLSSHPKEGIETYASVPAALEAVRNEKMVFIIGGGEVFRQTVGMADEIVLTEVENDAEGDVVFPAMVDDRGRPFVEAKRDVREGYSVVTYRRATG